MPKQLGSFTLPKLSTSSRDLIGTWTAGQTIFNVTIGKPQYYTGATWVTLEDGGGGSEVIIVVAVDPTVNDDNTLGYFVGQRWINTTTLQSYIAIDVSTGAAVWKEITGIEGIETGSNGEIILNSGVSLGTAVTPPILNANTNDLVITGIETAIVVRLSTSGNYSLTGIEPKDDTTAWMLFIANVGTNNIALKNNDANSLAVNRFLIGGDKNIQPDEGILLFYDPVTKRWRGSGILI